MKTRTRRTAALVLAVFISLPTVALAASPKGGGNDRERGPITRVIKKLQKLFGVSSNDDGLGVPVPNPPPKP